MNNLSQNLTIIITGAGGFLGKELIKQLSSESKHNIIAITSNPTELKKEVDGDYLTVINSENWQDNIKTSIDILINCAFPRSSNPVELSDGILYTENLIKDAIQLNIKSIINISSQSVYSQKEKTVIDESATVCPESLYGMTKFACERIVASLCVENQVNYSNIRLGSLMGINLGVRMTNRFVKSALNGEKIVVHGGNQKISYLDVRDAASALIKMVNVSPTKWDNIYNLGSNEYLTVLELVKQVIETAKDYTSLTINIDVKTKNDNFNNIINSDRFYNAFEWEPKYNIPLCLIELFDYYSVNNK